MPPLAPPLAVSLAGLEAARDVPWSGGPRAAIQWAAAVGFRAVQLDGAAAGIRPRNLDRSARRDLAALLRRSQLALSGIDLWIPPQHFTDRVRSERAIAALRSALELAADLSRLLSDSPPPVVSLTLPADLSPDFAREIETHADSQGVRIADHTVTSGAPAPHSPAGSPIGVGIDPAALLLAGQDPILAAARAGSSLYSARLSDASTGVRTVPGSGRLDRAAYFAALDIAGYRRPVVLDLRDVPNQDAAARSAKANSE